MINKSYMKELIENLKKNAPNRASWVEFILHSIEDEDLSKSGFSEYETYGNFVTLNYKDSYICRPIKSTRNGTMLYGINPSKCDIFSLMHSGYLLATFENYHSRSKKQIVINTVKSRCLYTLSRLTNSCRGQLKAAAELCRSPAKLIV
ncbi:MAG: hypothetical protein LH702_16995 [Phormidesmis sp. CAN_BIN44]|nr:hypothetical protein [Phormidesmis sp. CAN_BIN44]